MQATAVILEEPKKLSIEEVAVSDPSDGQLLVDVAWSGISTGTEKLLWSGRMPSFPGMGYPLVPGYEAVGRVRRAASGGNHQEGALVFVPGSRSFESVKGLFGAAASQLVVDQERALLVPDHLGEKATLMALAATAVHALEGGQAPDLIIGHGVLGRLIARLATLRGQRPTVWETDPGRQGGAHGYNVTTAAEDDRRDYRCIYDVSGDASLLDELIARLIPGGELVLAGFYAERPSFDFAPAFMRELTLRISAEWQPADLKMASALVADGRLSLDGLITHRASFRDAESAYQTAFDDPGCLKMILDWRDAQ